MSFVRFGLDLLKRKSKTGFNFILMEHNLPKFFFLLSLIFLGFGTLGSRIAKRSIEEKLLKKLSTVAISKPFDAT